MRSYSDDIPNVSTEEFKRSADVADQTNQLVKNNLAEIEAVAHNLQAVSEEVRTNLSLTKDIGIDVVELTASSNRKLKWVTALLVLALLGQGAIVALLVI